MKGSTFESLLDEAGIKEEVYADATKRVLAYRLQELMQEKGISKTQIAERMETSRSQLDRLLDPENEAVQLNTPSSAIGSDWNL